YLTLAVPLRLCNKTCIRAASRVVLWERAGRGQGCWEEGDEGEDEEVQVFLVEVLCNGRRHTVAKRYSEFQALHKRIKKSCKVPDFPPRRVPNWVPKVLEQRRQGLELYIQGVLCHNEELPQDVLDFLKVRQQGGCWALTSLSCHSVSHSPSQRPVLGFHTDPYTQPPATDVLPNTVLSGVLQGLYTPWHCPPYTAMPLAQLGF
uniref:Sorting nexin 22 n=1 Tax=Phasianus colchicus TaxID=9054 RepID=A0A669PIJ0_PHACC